MATLPVMPKQNGIVPRDTPVMLEETTTATWLAIGLLAESLGDYERALASYDSALRHSPNNLEALIGLANIYRLRDVFFKAAELYEQALNYSPENGETWGLLGHCYLMLDDLQRAYAAYQRALYYLDNPNVPKLWHGIGILYDRYGLLEYAEEAFVRVLELDPKFDKSNEIYFRLGIIYKHQGKLQLALECFQYILASPPQPLTQPDVWFQIGSVLEQQKDWNGAKEAYERVLQVNPQHAKVLQQLGCLYSQAEPAKPDQNQPFQQDLTQALKYLSLLLEIDQLDAHSWYYLGRVHMLRGDFNAAYEAFQQAVNRDSRNPTFWCSIGVLYYQISQYRDALDAYTRAIRLNPYISEVWYDLGTLYETCNNQISDALDAYRQAERLDPGNPHIKARLDQLIKYQQEGNTHPPQPPPVSQQPRLPQGMVLESTVPTPPLGGNGATNTPGAPGPPGAAPVGLPPAHHGQSGQPPMPAPGPLSFSQQNQPPPPGIKKPKTTTKRELDDKKDKKKTKKARTPQPQHAALHSVLNAPNGAQEVQANQVHNVPSIKDQGQAKAPIAVPAQEQLGQNPAPQLPLLQVPTHAAPPVVTAVPVQTVQAVSQPVAPSVPQPSAAVPVATTLPPAAKPLTKLPEAVPQVETTTVVNPEGSVPANENGASLGPVVSDKSTASPGVQGPSATETALELAASVPPAEASMEPKAEPVVQGAAPVAPDAPAAVPATSEPTDTPPSATDPNATKGRSATQSPAPAAQQAPVEKQNTPEPPMRKVDEDENYDDD